ncbi:M20/M25/M40 family metallo-hydrolase [Bizionia psychrotolerans]|uniref:M20/M25/M40 family metallo-hydrolase n=1 Tax=Bizionia psychrotolerans TaxID=1492901 RepID=UPI00069FEF23|nr:M20/M25/M40 family metallo-hydrolase [Bizionia psychrotolerans]
MPLKFTLLLALLFLYPKLEIYASDLDDSTIIYKNEHYSIQQILSKYLQINSISGNEFEAGEFLKNLCKENGLFITQMGNENGNYNFSASIRPLEKDLLNIVLLNHIDVVPPGDLDKWEFPPFSGAITDSEVWGRGAFDNKGMAIMQLFSVIEIANRFKNKPIKYNVTFLAVSCEETQCEGGIGYVIENYLDIINPAVVIGEGPPALKGLITNKPDLSIFGVSVTQKRALWLRLNLEIKTNGHSSVTPLTYANKEMVTALNNLLDKKPKISYNKLTISLLKSFGDLNEGFTGFALKHPKFFKPLITAKLRKEPVLRALFTNTITLTSLSDGNTKFNVIPDDVSAILDCRLLPNESTENFISYLKKSLDNDLIEIEIIKETLYSDPSSENTIFYKNLKGAIQQNYPYSKIASVILPNANDAPAFRAHGIPAYSTVPIKLEKKYLESVHTYNERIPKDVLQKGHATYTRFLELCLE